MKRYGETAMKAWSGHIVFDKKIRYKDLLPVYEELYTRFLRETDQVNKEEPESDLTILRTNLMDLERNRKPEGYNRMGKIRMMFPIKDRPEIYIYRQSRSQEVVKVSEALSDFLNENGIKNHVEWDRMFLYKIKRRK